MSAPAGPCEWCGGPQHWTIIAGEVYVSCDEGCLPLDLEGLVPPMSASELQGGGGLRPVSELLGSMGVVPLEGRETETSRKRVE